MADNIVNSNQNSTGLSGLFNTFFQTGVQGVESQVINSFNASATGQQVQNAILEQKVNNVLNSPLFWAGLILLGLILLKGKIKI